MKVATSTGVKLPTISIKTEQNVPISDIATNRYGDLFVINGTHRWEGTWDDGVLPPAWPATCPFPYSFVSKWLANGKPVTRMCMDFNNLLPEKITADFAGDPIILGKAPGHMFSPVSVRKLNHITLAPVWQVGLPSQVGITNVRSISADRWTGQSIIASFGTGYGGPVLPTKNVFSLANTGAVRWQRKWTQLATDAAIIPLTAVASDGNIMTYGSNTASDAVLNKYAR